MNKKKVYSLSLRLVGVAVFLYIISSINFKLFLQEFFRINVVYLIFAFILMLAVVIIRSLRWRSILALLGIKIDRLLSIKLFWLGSYVGIATPGKIGEVIKIYFLKIKGYSSLKSLLSIVADRATDIFVVILVGLLVAIFYLHVLVTYVIILGLVFVLLAIFIFLIFYYRIILFGFVNKFFGSFLIQKFNYHKISLESLRFEIKNLKVKYFAWVLFYLVLSWFLYFFSSYLIAQSLHIPISPLLVVVTVTAVTIVSFLPISIAGIGTRDITIIYIFSLINLSKESAIVFSLFILIIDLLTVSLGLIPYLKESSLIAKAKNA